MSVTLRRLRAAAPGRVAGRAARPHRLHGAGRDAADRGELVRVDGRGAVMPTFISAPHIRHAAYRVARSREPGVSRSASTPTFPPEVLSSAARQSPSRRRGGRVRAGRAAGYLGSEQATPYLAQIDHRADTAMARIASRPAGSSRARLPDPHAERARRGRSGAPPGAGSSIPSATDVMHARVFGTPSTTTRQSKHTPMPQKTPRGAPSTVVRVATCPRRSAPSPRSRPRARSPRARRARP